MRERDPLSINIIFFIKKITEHERKESMEILHIPNIYVEAKFDLIATYWILLEKFCNQSKYYYYYIIILLLLLFVEDSLSYFKKREQISLVEP